MPENIHDKGYRRLFSHKKNFIEFLNSFTDLTKGEIIEEDSVEQMETSFVGKDFADKEADLIYRAKIKGMDIFFYFLFELQSSVDFTMVFRLLIYIYSLWLYIFNNTDEKERERKEFKLPLVIPMVLYNGSDEWTAARTFKEYLNLSGYENLDEYAIDFKYLLINVNKLGDDELKQVGNLISSIFLLDKKQNIVKLISNLDTVFNNIKNLSKDDQVLFFDWIRDVLFAKVGNKQAEALEGAIKNFEKGDDEKMTYAIQRLIDELRDEGKQEGKMEGKMEGRKEGLAEVVKNMLMGGYSLNEIIKLTGFNSEEIQSIKNSNSQPAI